MARLVRLVVDSSESPSSLIRFFESINVFGFFPLITSLFETMVKQSAREADCSYTESNDVFTKLGCVTLYEIVKCLMKFWLLHILLN